MTHCIFLRDIYSTNIRIYLMLSHSCHRSAKLCRNDTAWHSRSVQTFARVQSWKGNGGTGNVCTLLFVECPPTPWITLATPSLWLYDAPTGSQQRAKRHRTDSPCLGHQREERSTHLTGDNFKTLKDNLWIGGEKDMRMRLCADILAVMICVQKVCWMS